MRKWFNITWSVAYCRYSVYFRFILCSLDFSSNVYVFILSNKVEVILNIFYSFYWCTLFQMSPDILIHLQNISLVSLYCPISVVNSLFYIFKACQFISQHLLIVLSLPHFFWHTILQLKFLPADYFNICGDRKRKLNTSPE